MEEIIARQRNAARPLTGSAFVRGVALVLAQLAAAQLLVNLAITLSGVGLLNIAFYLYAVWALVGFMRRTVAGSTYVLKQSTLTLCKMLGDSTTSVVEIPTAAIVSVRPVLRGERLESSYHRVTVIDAAALAGWRMRLAFWLSLLSARLARRVAGGAARQQRGYVAVYTEEGKRQACVFLPDESFLGALEAMLPDAFDLDERTQENTPVTMMAQALERAFPDLYPFVTPLLNQEREQAAREEMARQKQARRAKRKKPGAAGECPGRRVGEKDDV